MFLFSCLMEKPYIFSLMNKEVGAHMPKELNHTRKEPLGNSVVVRNEVQENSPYRSWPAGVEHFVKGALHLSQREIRDIILLLNDFLEDPFLIEKRQPSSPKSRAFRKLAQCDKQKQL